MSDQMSSFIAEYSSFRSQYRQRFHVGVHIGEEEMRIEEKVIADLFVAYKQDEYFKTAEVGAQKESEKSDEYVESLKNIHRQLKTLIRLQEPPKGNVQ
jgi:hypothetical protein